MLLISYPFLAHTPAKTPLVPPTRIAASASRIGTPASGQRPEHRPGEPVIGGLGHYIDSHLDASALGTGHLDGAVEVGGLGRYIDNRLGEGRFRIG
jgi:hypothetical protein